MRLSKSVEREESALYIIPGSHVIARYVKSSHQNDPGRTALLALFAIRTLPQSRTRADNGEKRFVQFSEKEVDELVDEWTPEPHSIQKSNPISRPYLWSLGPRPKLANAGKRVLNLASYNFTGLAIKVRAIETLRKYGVGSCGPPGFYGTTNVHMDLERDIADFLGTEASILYSQGFSTIPCVISAFEKRGDIIVADRGVNFAIRRGCKFRVLRFVASITMTSKASKIRFTLTEGIFEKDGAMVDLPKLIELEHKYKYRLIDESISFGPVGRTGRGLTELYNVPVCTSFVSLSRSVVNGLNSSGGFCACSRIVVDHQRINGTSFVFSAAVPVLLEVSASEEGINILRNTPSILSTLQENPSNPATPAPSFDIVGEERLLQDIVDEALMQSVWTARAGAG
ncbi:serine palmitoyltransferase [Lactarius deliciosus]|nr:serine palmitoyltransferase [Lactarius deliciosus]